MSKKKKNNNKIKTKTRVRKERIMKNVDEFYKKYCNAYKSKYDTDDELNEAKPKRFDHNQLNDCITKIVEMNLMKEQN